MAADRITDARLVHLKGMTNLQRFSLFARRVTDAGLMHLKGLMNLERLGIEGTRLPRRASPN